MRYTRFWTAATIIGLVVVIGFIISVPHTTREAPTTSLIQETVAVPTVLIRDSFKKGVHTITGSIEAPNACAKVAAEASYVEGAVDPEHILVAISLTKDGGVCLQLPTKIPFSTAVQAAAGLPIIASVNGLLASTTTL